MLSSLCNELLSSNNVSVVRSYPGAALVNLVRPWLPRSRVSGSSNSEDSSKTASSVSDINGRGGTETISIREPTRPAVEAELAVREAIIHAIINLSTRHRLEAFGEASFCSSPARKRIKNEGFFGKNAAKRVVKDIKSLHDILYLVVSFQ